MGKKRPMNGELQRGFIFYFSLTVGLVESATGIGLVLVPDLVLELMGHPVNRYPLELVRFIGAFVFAVGGLYLWGVCFSRKEYSVGPMLYAWLATGWVRLCVALVTGTMVLSGALTIAWISVPLTDAALGLFQLFWILNRRSSKNES